MEKAELASGLSAMKMAKDLYEKHKCKSESYKDLEEFLKNHEISANIEKLLCSLMCGKTGSYYS